MTSWSPIVFSRLMSWVVHWSFVLGVITTEALAIDSQVPPATSQGEFLAPQAVSTLDISDDARFITVGTMAFSHDANVWQYAPDGTVLSKRRLPPWAPLQVATLPGGEAMAVGLAYSRGTAPDPTVWLGRASQLTEENPKEELVEADSRDGQLSRLRPGSGKWRVGWYASTFGELFVRGPDWVFKPPSRFLDVHGQRQQLRYEDKNQLPTSRALRMAASRDGKRLAFGWLGYNREVVDIPQHRNAISVWQIKPNASLWSAGPTVELPPPLDDPVADFSELAKSFRLNGSLLLPGHATAAVAINRDGSRVAIVEYAVWGWVRGDAAIGRWDPPIKVLNFLPKQSGRLRVFNGEGSEIYQTRLPAEGMFEIGFDSSDDAVWCWPSSWFSRGMAGCPWLPIDSTARAVYRIDVNHGSVMKSVFPEAIADVGVSPARQQAIVSCWDGKLYVVNGDGKSQQKLEVGGPARLAWSRDGEFAMVGTAQGDLIRVDHRGDVAWRKPIPVTAAPAPDQPKEVIEGLPIYQGGRIPKSEHAYVGDIWIIKSGRNAVMVDSAGLSGISMTQARLRALDIDRVTHVLHTHTHGDHAGGAHLWRVAGAKTVGPESAAFNLTWLMPMLTDYGNFPPCPLDVPLPLKHAGDEHDFEIEGLKFRALFVPGHSFDSTIYKVKFEGRRVAFTGDLGFENQDILHRCWGDADKARMLVGVIREKLLAWRPDIVITGHGVRMEGLKFIEQLLAETEQSLAKRKSN